MSAPRAKVEVFTSKPDGSWVRGHAYGSSITITYTPGGSASFEDISKAHGVPAELLSAAFGESTARVAAPPAEAVEDEKKSARKKG